MKGDCISCDYNRIDEDLEKIKSECTLFDMQWYNVKSVNNIKQHFWKDEAQKDEIQEVSYEKVKNIYVISKKIYTVCFYHLKRYSKFSIMFKFNNAVKYRSI